MIDPTKLIQGAKAVYGESFDKLYNPIIPIPAERICIMRDGDTLKIAANRTLTFYDTPGHTKHHIIIYSNGIFTRGILWASIIANLLSMELNYI